MIKPAIVIQTDFRRDSPDVCTMYGVALMVDPELRIYDSTHSVPEFDIFYASRSLLYVVDFWSPGTVFVSVVDPGVGTNRVACVAKLKNGSYVVTPDNGSLTHLKKYFGIEEVRIIDETKHRLESTRKVSIFHGRDLFAYCAAKLAAGIITYEEVGESYPLDQIVETKIIEPHESDGYIHGMIESADPYFGLVCSNIPIKFLEDKGIKNGDMVAVVIKHKGETVYDAKAPYFPSFGFVPVGDELVITSENQMVQIAINMGNFTEKYGISTGADWIFAFKKA